MNRKNKDIPATAPRPVSDNPAPPSVPIDADMIAQRAYERYAARGGEDGHDQEDWFEAERELGRGN